MPLANYAHLSRHTFSPTLAESTSSFSSSSSTAAAEHENREDKTNSYRELSPGINLALEKLLAELERENLPTTKAKNSNENQDFSLRYLFLPAANHTLELRLLKYQAQKGQDKVIPLPTVLKKRRPYFRAEDWTIVQLWWAALSLESSRQDTFSLMTRLPQGALLEQLIPLILETGRAHWQSPLLPPLTLGSPLEAHFQWQELAPAAWAPLLKPTSGMEQPHSWRSPLTLYYQEKKNALGFLLPPQSVSPDLLILISGLPVCNLEQIPLVSALLNHRQGQTWLYPPACEEASIIKEIRPEIIINAKVQKAPGKNQLLTMPQNISLYIYLVLTMNLPPSFSSFTQVKSYFDESKQKRVIEIISTSAREKVKELLEAMGFTAGELSKTVAPGQAGFFKNLERNNHEHLSPDLQNQCFRPTTPAVFAHFLSTERYRLKKLGCHVNIEKELDFPIVDGALAEAQWHIEILEHPEEYIWCNLEVSLKLYGEVFSLLPILKEELKHLPPNLNEQEKKSFLNHQGYLYTYLKDKRILRLPFERIESLLDTLMAVSPFQKQLTLISEKTKFPITSIQQLFRGFNLAWNNPGPLKELVENLEQIKSLKPLTPAAGFCGTLRPYQAEGLAWLQFIARYKLSGILADDMGLGKTIQILAHIWTDKEERICSEKLFREKQEEAIIDVTILEDNCSRIEEKTTKPDERDKSEQEIESNNDIERDAAIEAEVVREIAIASEVVSSSRQKPYLVVCPLSVLPNWQNETRKFTPELNFLAFHGNKREQNLETLRQQDIVFTTYGTLIKEVDRLKSIHWRGIILDESQCIKNARTINKATVNKLISDHKICLTGTPLENNLRELWSQFDFLIPGLLGKYRHFCKHFSGPIENYRDTAKTELLHQKIAPFLLRRNKESVAPELPAKIIIHHEVVMTDSQREFYCLVAEEVWKAFYGVLSRHSIHIPYTRFFLIRALLRLRQICCHPRLVPIDHNFNESAKFEALFDLLPTLLAEGRKILLFSQFTKMLDLIKVRLREEEIDFVELRGSTKDREKPLRDFKEGKCSLFLISLKAGGTGLNITTADTIIHYDPWWNPAVENQATDRAHRIGQTKTVFVHRLITLESVEEKLMVIQNRKRQLYQDILDNGDLTTPSFTEEDLNFLFQPPEEER